MKTLVAAAVAAALAVPSVAHAKPENHGQERSEEVHRRNAERKHRKEMEKAERKHGKHHRHDDGDEDRYAAPAPAPRSGAPWQNPPPVRAEPRPAQPRPSGAPWQNPPPQQPKKQSGAPWQR